MPGDFATVEDDGRITLLGRGSVCINTGGEKVFPEEVEQALKAHPDVFDAIVVGVPDERWGQRVAAVVAAPRRPRRSTLDDLDAHCRELRRRLQGAASSSPVDRDRPLAQRQARLPVGQDARRSGHQQGLTTSSQNQQGVHMQRLRQVLHRREVGRVRPAPARSTCISPATAGARRQRARVDHRRHGPRRRRRPRGVRPRPVAAHDARPSAPTSSRSSRPPSRPAWTSSPRSSPTRTARPFSFSQMGQVFAATAVLDYYAGLAREFAVRGDPLTA